VNPFRDAKDFAGDDCVLVTGYDGRNRCALNLGSCLDLFSNHAADFVLRASVACCEPKHPKSDDILSVETKLDSLEGQREPEIKQKSTCCCEGWISTIILLRVQGK
jgi:hypothetical protein